MITDDYKKGWYDGYQAAKNETTKPVVVPTQAPSYTKSCTVCGMAFTNPDGTLKVMGYVCVKPNCPSKISSSTISYPNHPGVPAKEQVII